MALPISAMSSPPPLPSCKARGKTTNPLRAITVRELQILFPFMPGKSIKED